MTDLEFFLLVFLAGIGVGLTVAAGVLAFAIREEL